MAKTSSPFITIEEKADKDLFYIPSKTTDTVDLGSESYKTFEEPIRNKSSLMPKKNSKLSLISEINESGFK